MNDIVLSAILNLFALFGVEHKLDKNKSLEIIIYYLKRSFSVLDRQSYIDLFNDLNEFYSEFPVTDISDAVYKICAKLHETMPKYDQALMLLRFMEFSNLGCEKLQKESKVIRAVQEAFSISEESYNDFCDFVSATPTEKVRLIPIKNNEGTEGGGGTLKTLFVSRYNALIFSYMGTSEAFMYDAPVDQFYHIWKQSAVLKSKDFSPIYYSAILSNYTHTINTSGEVTLQARNVEFRFSNGDGDNGLHNFTTTVKGGELVAIMGGSGVGKSTLMSLLIGNLIPKSGTIRINGRDVTDPIAKSLIGFVPQDDLLIEELTVYQNLWYTAKLCFDGLSDEELDRKVNTILQQLELDKAKDLKVGSPIKKYISGGQRKRLNIAMELIREPAVIFLDEPTSGLSSTDSEKVINILKMLTFKGKLIVMNIHQPSSDIYKLFDRLWILDKGGYPVFDGNPIDAISYFKREENYADANVSACKTCGNVRPELILNIIDSKLVDATGQITEKRKTMPKQWHERYLSLRKEPEEISSNASLPKSQQQKPGILKQMAIFFSRNFKTKLSNLQYMLVTLLEAPLLAVICGFLTHYTKDGELYTVMDNKNMVTYFFMAVIVAIFMGMSASAEEIIKDRAILKREKFLNLSYSSYISSKILFMASVSLIQTFLFVLIGNLIAGIHGLFFVWWIVLFISSFLSSLVGLLLSQCLNSVVAIYITIPILLIPQILLCGLVVDFDDLNPNSKTGYVPVIGDVIPSRWAYEALAVANFSMNDYEKDFFQQDRQKYSSIYYKNAYLYELQSQLETYKDKLQKGEDAGHHMDVVRAGLPKISSVCNTTPYNGDYSYESLDAYFNNCSDILSNVGNRTTLAVDAQISRLIKQYGRDGFLQLKKDNFNQQLENLVVNSNTEKMCVIRGNSIVPKTGYIFLRPDSNIGRAPFYSGCKVLFGMEIHTLWFNISVMILMSLFLSLLLYTDVPGKYVREERN